MEYHGFGYIVDSCPLNETEQAAAASRLKCGVDEYSNSQYVCAPNAQRTAIVEYCYKSTVGLQSAGTCLKVHIDGSYDAVSCTSFIKGCTTDHFSSANLYKYPACHQINTKDRCYYEDPACPKINNDTTVSVSSTPTSLSNGTDGTWDYSIVTTNSASRGLPNSTETALNHTIGTTVQSDDNVMKAVLTGSFAGVLILVLAIVLLLFLRLRTKNKDEKIMQSEIEIPELQRFIPESDLPCITTLKGENEVFSDGNVGEDYFSGKLSPEYVLSMDGYGNRKRQRRLGDYSVWKTSLSGQFSSLSDDEVCVLFCFLCSDSGTPDFTDTEWLDILNEIREDVYSKGSVTSEEAQRTLDGLKSRGFLWDEDGVHLSEDVKDETMHRVTGGVTERATVLPFAVFGLSSYTTAVRYLRSWRYTRKSGEKCVISDDPFCDYLLIRRLQMDILTHVTMEDTGIYDNVSQILNIPENIVRMGDEERRAFLEKLKQTGECVQYRGASQGSEQHVNWLWRERRNARPDIVRSCIGLHPHCDIYIINNTAYRKHTGKYHEYPEDVRCRLYSLLFADQYTVNVKDHSYQDVLQKIRDRYYTEFALVYDEACMRNLPGDIVQTRGDAITLKSEGIRHDVMYAFLTECLLKDSDLKFFLTTASRDVISEYCRSWDYKRSEGERCLYIPGKMYDLFIDRLQLDILTHCTMSDGRIHNRISERLGVPDEILDWDLEARKRYVEYAKRGTQVIHHARGMIVGCAGAGKTTILKRLLRCSDAEIRDVKSTEGLEVNEEIFLICEDTNTLKARTKNIDNKNRSTTGDDEMTVTFFDFGGQCAYYACHQIYLTRRAFYMLVLDASKPLHQVVDEKVCDQEGSVFSKWTYRDYFVFWIKSIHTYCGTEKEIGEPEPEVIIVATHWDENVYENDKDSLITSLQHQFPTNSTLGTRYIRDDNIFLTSFSQEPPLEILSDLEKYIFDIVCQKRWAEKIPKEWAFMEVEIPKTKSTKRIERTRALSRMMPKQNAVYDMLRYYHDAGKILYFHETDLQMLIIIDVQWFVDAFKNIITDKLHKRGIKASLNDWDEYYQTGHLKDCLLTEIWRKNDLDLHKELLEKGKAAIEDDISQDPQYLLPHKDDILMFMNRLGLIAVGEDSHYVPCMNRDEIDENLASSITGSMNRTSVLVFQFDFLPYFLFYQLVVASMLGENWKVLKSREKQCLYKNAALFFSTDHHIVLSVTETTIQLQVYLPGTDGNLDVKKTHQIQMVIEDKLQEITSSSRRGKGYIRGFICENGSDQPTITASTELFISETDIAKIHGDKITCPLHGGDDHHYIYKTQITKYWKTSISSN